MGGNLLVSLLAGFGDTFHVVYKVATWLCCALPGLVVANSLKDEDTADMKADGTPPSSTAMQGGKLSI